MFQKCFYLYNKSHWGSKQHRNIDQQSKTKHETNPKPNNNLKKSLKKQQQQANIRNKTLGFKVIGVQNTIGTL